ncbi:cadherin domain-containing protein [Aeromonas cavernicola]|uniref:Cadherin domain-containing protein n=1 Tax=Aeromonas cavernicola TaxID=1006623 RepID=A0A2H9U1R4_9GAMM|nr:cadherin domain-containing protein [Aeromonas cavernicola]PJG57996.1 hypothetical protein CUC53_14940 [Aeromonas cavernicola]
MKKQVKNRLVIRRTSVAAGLLAALLSHGAAALVSTNTAGPVHGRQIVITAAPDIDGTGVIGVPVTLPAVPGYSDEDGDALTDWLYTWQLDGVDVGTEQLAGSISAIPSYVPTAADAGKKLTLKLQAVADARSFPVATGTSEARASDEITIIAGNVNIDLGEGIDKDVNIPGSIDIDANGNGHGPENTEIKVDMGSSIAENNNPNGDLTWSISGPDAGQFEIDENTGVVTLKPQDAENPKDADGNGTYEVQVTVTDPATGATDEITIVITVDNTVEEAESVRVVDANGVSITGNPVVGTELHSAVTLKDGLNNTPGVEVRDRADATYQWQRRDTRTADSEWVNVDGATNPTYTLTGADQGFEFRVDANGK